MSLLITNEDYNGANFLSSNSGGRVISELTFLHYVEYICDSVTTGITSVTNGGISWLVLEDGSDWSEHGFADGKSISIIQTLSGVPITITSTINYLDGNLMFVTTGLGNSYSPQIDNATGNVILSLEIRQASAPEKLEFDFNLTNPNSPSLNSLIDGNVNRFNVDNIDAMVVGASLPMVQINSKSGGLITSASLKLESSTGSPDYQRVYKIFFKFVNWTYIQNGDNNPTWFDGVGTVGAIARVRMFAELGNPNTVMETTSSNSYGNCGNFDENYNTGVETYTLSSASFTDSVGNPVSGIDYCALTKFTAVIDAPAGRLNTTYSNFRIGMSWIPADEDDYQNKNDSFGNNLAVNASEAIFSHSTSPFVTPIDGYLNNEYDIQWSFNNLQFTIGGGQLTVTGDIYPTNGNNDYFDTVNSGEKKHVLWVDTFRNDYVPNQQLRTSVKVYDQDVICSPPLGSLYSVINNIFDHDNNPNQTETTTEDDVLLRDDWLMPRNTVFQDLTVGFQMYNTVTGESFNLEQFVFDFSTAPFINGVYEINQSIPRNFNLPPTSNKNEVKISRQSSLPDDAFNYSLGLSYGYLNDWRYWLAKANANIDFFNPLESNNGLNRDWEHFQSGNWVFRHEFLLRKDNVSDFFYKEIPIRPYEDEDVSDSTILIDLSNGSTVTSLIDNTEIEVSKELIWNLGIYDPTTAWAEVTIEDFEGGNRWVLSSVEEQGSISANPLKSIIASDKLEMLFFNNIATLKYKIDTNIIDINNVSFTYRIYSDLGVGEWTDLRLGGNVLSIGGENTGSDIEHDEASKLTRKVDGLECFPNGTVSWEGWVSFPIFNFNRVDSTTIEYIIKTIDTDTAESMLGIAGSGIALPQNTDLRGYQETSVYYDLNNKFIDIYGNDGTVGTPSTKSFDTGVNASGHYKVKITDSGTLGCTISVYELADGIQTSWNDETNLVHSEVSTLTPDEIALMPFCLLNDEPTTLVAIRVV